MGLCMGLRMGLHARLHLKQHLGGEVALGLQQVQRAQVGRHPVERRRRRQHRQHVPVRRRPAARRDLQLGTRVAPVGHRVGRDEKDEQFAGGDRLEDVVVVGAAGRQVLAVEEDLVAGDLQPVAEVLGQRTLRRGIGQEDVQTAVPAGRHGRDRGPTIGTGAGSDHGRALRTWGVSAGRTGRRGTGPWPRAAGSASTDAVR